MRLAPVLRTFALATALALPAFTASAETTLNVTWPTNVGPLNPHLYSPNQMFAQAMVYEPLVRYMPDGTIAPWLATSWDISPDGKVYTFRLRPDVKFSDGLAFDASAVKKNFDGILMNSKRHDWLDFVAQLQAVDVIDPLTVRITLKRAYFPTLYDLALIRPLRFLSPAAFPDTGTTADAIKAPVGTGPWMLVETKRGEYDVFKRNDSYWGDKPGFDQIVIKVLPDINTRAIALETGQVDLAYGSGLLSGDTFARFKRVPGFTATVSQPVATQSIAMNSKTGATADLAVRKAVEHAVDKDAIVKGILYDVEKKADFLFAPNVPNADVGLKPYAYDPKLAAKILDEAGWTLDAAQKVRVKDGKPLEIELCFVGNDAKQKAISETVQAMLAKIGMRVKLVGEEANSIYARQKDGSFGMIFGDTWGAPYDPHAFLGSMRSPSHADYQAQLGLPMKAELDDKITKVLVSTDAGERKELFRWILTTLHEQAVYLPMTYLTIQEVNGKAVDTVTFGGTAYEIPFEKMKPTGK